MSTVGSVNAGPPMSSRDTFIAQAKAVLIAHKPGDWPADPEMLEALTCAYDESLREVLATYGHHRVFCVRLSREWEPCNCGYAELTQGADNAN